MLNLTSEFQFLSHIKMNFLVTDFTLDVMFFHVILFYLRMNPLFDTLVMNIANTTVANARVNYQFFLFLFRHDFLSQKTFLEADLTVFNNRRQGIDFLFRFIRHRNEPDRFLSWNMPFFDVAGSAINVGVNSDVLLALDFLE